MKLETAGIRSWVIGVLPGPVIVAIWCLLSLYLLPAHAGEFAVAGGASTGAYATRVNNWTAEISWLPSDKWDLSLGYVAKQDEPCNECRTSGLVRFITPTGERVYVYTLAQDADKYLYLSGTRTLVMPMGRGIDAVLGVGAIVASEESVLLSQRLNFSLQAGIRWRSLDLVYRHFSNAGTNMPNYGQNLMELRYRFGD